MDTSVLFPPVVRSRTRPRLRVHWSALALLTPLALFLLFGTQATLTADDYCQAADTRDYGVLGMVTHRYQTWGGRFSQTSTSATLYTLFGASAPAAGAVLVIGALTLAAFALFGTLGVLLMPALLLALGGAVWQGIYWLPGGVTYALPLALTGALVWALRRKTHPALLLALALLIGGFNESYGLVLALGLLLFRKWTALAGVLVGTALVMLAPGNAVRAEHLVRSDLYGAVSQSALLLLEHDLSILLSAPVALLAALVVGMAFPRRLDGRVLLTLAAGHTFPLFTTLYATSLYAPRTLVIPTAALLGMCFVIGQQVGRRTPLTGQLKAATVALVLVASISFAGATLVSKTTFEQRVGVASSSEAWVADCLTRLTR